MKIRNQLNPQRSTFGRLRARLAIQAGNKAACGELDALATRGKDLPLRAKSRNS